MKVLFLDQYSDLGGAQQCLLELLPALERERWHAVVAAPGNGPMLDAAARHGAVTHWLPARGYSLGRKSLRDVARFLRATPELSRTIAELIDRHRPTLLYINGPRMLPAVAWLGAPNCPVVFHSHHYLAKRYATRLAGWALRRLNASVISCCDFVGTQWSASVTPSRLHTVYNGVPDLRREVRGVDAVATVGIVGRISPEKGQLLFVEAARILSTLYPWMRFEVIGEVLFSDRAAEAYRRTVVEAATGLPIRFRGWLESAQDAFAGLDLLVVPSTAPEATTRVIPEAWSAGVPVVAAAIGGIAEIVENEVNGFLTPHPTAESIAARVANVLESPPDKLAQVIAAGRLTYERRFTIDRYRREILEICVQA